MLLATAGTLWLEDWRVWQETERRQYPGHPGLWWSETGRHSE